ncbi:MAG TPA: hypothetical protein VEW42_02295 [Candidatus Eisenbacteria bacterium]|nr:hypothetical protein [Candidatus Eisenbacteria bacterium]
MRAGLLDELVDIKFHIPFQEDTYSIAETTLTNKLLKLTGVAKKHTLPSMSDEKKEGRVIGTIGPDVFRAADAAGENQGENEAYSVGSVNERGIAIIRGAHADALSAVERLEQRASLRKRFRSFTPPPNNAS